MKLSNKVKEEIKDLSFIMTILLLLILCFSVVSGQNMMSPKLDIPLIELNLDTKPQNYKQKNSINERVIIFIAGTTLTAVGIAQEVINKNNTFKYSNMRSSIPINPNNMLIGIGLFTMSISIVI
jgi:hypothetical protein|tara:strand:+ start:2197 stop:2568 length:372 start_codon:yes stop_codon:yes gene_type:complete